MISFRLPWYALIGGLLIALIACFLPVGQGIKLSVFLPGLLLLLDGGFGVQTLPRLTPFASFPDDWREIERNMYLRKLGVVRFAVAAVVCLSFILLSTVIGAGNWQGWFMGISVAIWSAVWIFAALKSIRDAFSRDH